MGLVPANQTKRWSVLVLIDFLLLLLASFLASWVVFCSLIPLFHSYALVNIVAIQLVLIAVRFYRIRVSESSLDVLNRSLAGFVPVFVISVLLCFLDDGFQNPWIPYLIVADGYGFLLVAGSRVAFRSFLNYRNKQ